VAASDTRAGGSATSASGPAPRPWRPLLRLALAPALIGLARLLAAWPMSGLLVLLPTALLALATCCTFGVALIALCLRQERYAAIEVGVGLVTMLATVLSIFAIVAGLSTEPGDT
jgi:hypothetical protein